MHLQHDAAIRRSGALDEMKQDYEKSKLDLQKGLEGIQAALEKLQTYYGAGQPALIQKSSDNGAAFAQAGVVEA